MSCLLNVSCVSMADASRCDIHFILFPWSLTKTLWWCLPSFMTKTREKLERLVAIMTIMKTYYNRVCDNDKTYISITLPKLLSKNDIILIINMNNDQ